MVTLWKKIVKENGMISYNKTYVSVGDQNNEVDFEDIDSHYPSQLDCEVVVCPRGKFHPYNFKDKSYITPDGKFEDKGDWDLRCFKHESGHFLIFYTNQEEYNFYSKCASCSDKGINKFYFGNVVYDYQMLENWQDSRTNYKYKCPSLLKEGSLKLYGTALTMNNGDHNVNRQNPAENKNVNDIKNYTQAYFDNDNKNYFRFFTYNNVSDFQSGYYEINVDTSNYNSDNFNITSYHFNSESPLSFVDNVEIKEMNFIRGTK